MDVDTKRIEKYDKKRDKENETNAIMINYKAKNVQPSRLTVSILSPELAHTLTSSSLSGSCLRAKVSSLAASPPFKCRCPRRPGMKAARLPLPGEGCDTQ